MNVKEIMHKQCNKSTAFPLLIAQIFSQNVSYKNPIYKHHAPFNTKKIPS